LLSGVHPVSSITTVRLKLIKENKKERKNPPFVC
jgi:hypothetical protein